MFRHHSNGWVEATSRGETAFGRDEAEALLCLTDLLDRPPDPQDDPFLPPTVTSETDGTAVDEPPAPELVPLVAVPPPAARWWKVW
jgi:hypothetical protein